MHLLTKKPTLLSKPVCCILCTDTSISRFQMTNFGRRLLGRLSSDLAKILCVHSPGPGLLPHKILSWSDKGRLSYRRFRRRRHCESKRQKARTERKCFFSHANLTRCTPLGGLVCYNEKLLNLPYFLMGIVRNPPRGVQTNFLTIFFKNMHILGTFLTVSWS